MTEQENSEQQTQATAQASEDIDHSIGSAQSPEQLQAEISRLQGLLSDYDRLKTELETSKSQAEEDKRRRLFAEIKLAESAVSGIGVAAILAVGLAASVKAFDHTISNCNKETAELARSLLYCQEQSHGAPAPPVCLATTATPTASQGSASITDPSVVARTNADETQQSTEEQLAPTYTRDPRLYVG